jgi:uncharacterized protein YbcI
MEPTDRLGDQERPQHSVSSAISNLVVRITREYTGRGPTQARTYMQDDLITVVLRETLTKGELRLVDNGRADHVRATRRYFQDAMREELVAGIEELTGRRVIAFLSDNHFDPDLAVELLLLEPRPTVDEPETGRSDGR